MTRRVVVTGIGVTSAFGVGREALLEGLAAGQPAFQPLEGLLGEIPPGRGALLDLPRKEFRDWFDTRVLRLSTMTRQTTLGCIACGALLRDADRPTVEGDEHADKGAYLGSFIVPPDFSKQFVAMQLLARRPSGQSRGVVLDDAGLAAAMKRASAFDFLRALPNMPSSHLSIQTGYQGPACTYLGSDSSGMQAMVMAVGAIQSGIANVMVAGGAFCPFQEVHLAWQQQRGLWTEAGEVLPYGKDRSGTLPGEGSALFCFEDRDTALARGATILGEVLGVGQRCLTPGAGEAVDVRAEVLRLALPEGSPDWIGPSALGHPELDGLEAQAYEQVFGDDLDRSGLVTVTPLVGFSGPAAGPLNFAGALLAGSGAVRPARSNIDAGADPACSRLAGALGRHGATGDGAVVLGSSFSLDGVHAALALRVGSDA